MELLLAWLLAASDPAAGLKEVPRVTITLREAEGLSTKALARKALGKEAVGFLEKRIEASPYPDDGFYLSLAKLPRGSGWAGLCQADVTGMFFERFESKVPLSKDELLYRGTIDHRLYVRTTGDISQGTSPLDADAARAQDQACKSIQPVLTSGSGYLVGEATIAETLYHVQVYQLAVKAAREGKLPIKRCQEDGFVPSPFCDNAEEILASRDLLAGFAARKAKCSDEQSAVCIELRLARPDTVGSEIEYLIRTSASSSDSPVSGLKIEEVTVTGVTRIS